MESTWNTQTSKLIELFETFSKSLFSNHQIHIDHGSTDSYVFFFYLMFVLMTACKKKLALQFHYQPGHNRFCKPLSLRELFWQLFTLSSGALFFSLSAGAFFERYQPGHTFFSIISPGTAYISKQCGSIRISKIYFFFSTLHPTSKYLQS